MSDKPDFAGHQPRIDVTVEIPEPEEQPVSIYGEWHSPEVLDKTAQERRKRHTVTWRQLIDVEMQVNEDSWDNMEFIAIDDQDSLDAQFDNDYGSINGCPFTAWTTEHVYFPIQYDGAEWVGSVPRHPNGKALRHQGGG